jgi:hypothetical protein
MMKNDNRRDPLAHVPEFSEGAPVLVVSWNGSYPTMIETVTQSELIMGTGERFDREQLTAQLDDGHYAVLAGHRSEVYLKSVRGMNLWASEQQVGEAFRTLALTGSARAAGAYVFEAQTLTRLQARFDETV